MKLNVAEELYKDEQGAINITNDIREIIDTIESRADAIKQYAEQMKKWTSGKYISDKEYEGMQYNIKRILGLSFVITENAQDLGDDFGV